MDLVLIDTIQSYIYLYSQVSNPFQLINSSLILVEKVPLPDPGAPIINIFISILLKILVFVIFFVRFLSNQSLYLTYCFNSNTNNDNHSCST